MKIPYAGNLQLLKIPGCAGFDVLIVQQLHATCSMKGDKKI
jgi:hypothetical protein